MAKPTPSPRSQDANEENEATRPGLEDLIATFKANPDKWVNAVFFTNADAEGRNGSSIGSIPAIPIDDLEQRALSMWGAPLRVNMRMRPVAGGFGPAFFMDIGERAAATIKHEVPPVLPTTSSDEVSALREEIRRLQEKISTPQAAAFVPSDPFSGAQRIHEMTMMAAEKIAAQRGDKPQDLATVIAVAKEAGAKSDAKIELAKEALPMLGGAISEFIGMIKTGIDARREDMIAMRKLESEQWHARRGAQNVQPTPAANLEPVPAVDPALFGTQGGTTGKSPVTPDSVEPGTQAPRPTTEHSESTDAQQIEQKPTDEKQKKERKTA